jgi:uncharacterized protein (DUF1330 family)
MSALLITVGRFRKNGDKALQQYVTGVVPLIAAARGEVVSRGRPLETVVGAPGKRPDLVAVMRFPNAEAIRGFLESQAYQAYVRFRNEAFEELRSYIADDLMAAPSDAARR